MKGIQRMYKILMEFIIKDNGTNRCFHKVVLALPLLYISVISEDHNEEEPFSQLK